MKIDSTVNAVGANKRARLGGVPSKKPIEKRSQVDESMDETHLFADGQKLQDLKAALNQLPDTRQDRIHSLRQALQKGSYQVSDSQIANAMLSDPLG
jgi:flagellar biosynthesis anti-sigma factor FlgM